MARYFRRMHHGTAYQHFARSRVSLGGLKHMLGAVVTTMLAEKVKTPEQRYLLLAGIGFMVGLAETSWRDHINAEWDAFRHEGSKGALSDAVFNFRIIRRKQRKLASERAPLLRAGPVFPGGYGLQ